MAEWDVDNLFELLMRRVVCQKRYLDLKFTHWSRML